MKAIHDNSPHAAVDAPASQKGHRVMPTAQASWQRGNYCLAVVRVVFWTAETLTVRLLLAWASAIYALLLVWPEIFNACRWVVLQLWPAVGRHIVGPHPSIFDRPAYALMASVPGGVWFWFVLFVAHWLGVHWRVFDRIERGRWSLAVNVLGLAIWAYSTIALMVAIGLATPSMGLELVVIWFSFWVLVRTGINSGILSE